MARKAVMILGDWELDWEPFARAVDVMKCAAFESAFSARGGFRRWPMQQQSKGLPLGPAHYVGHISRCRPRQGNRLFDLLYNAHKRSATKPVDHIFAMLGIADEVVRPDLDRLPCGWDAQSLFELVAIDYTKPPSQVFRDATLFIILTHDSLFPLTMAGLAENQASSDSPSWVPLWAQPPRSPLFWLGRDVRDMYSADLGRKMQSEVHQNSNELHVSGYMFEEIQALAVELKADTSVRESWHYPPSEEEINFVASAWSLVQSIPNTLTMTDGTPQRRCQSYHDILEAFLYTLCANQSDVESQRADAGGPVLKSGKIWLESFIPGFPRSTSLLSRAWHVIQTECDYAAPGLLFQGLLLRTCASRRFFLAFSGYMGIGPSSIEEGDFIAVLFGLSLPVVLRPSHMDASKYILVGPCFVQGIMDGEAVAASDNQAAKIFTLV